MGSSFHTTTSSGPGFKSLHKLNYVVTVMVYRGIHFTQHPTVLGTKFLIPLSELSLWS